MVPDSSISMVVALDKRVEMVVVGCEAHRAITEKLSGAGTEHALPRLLTSAFGIACPRQVLARRPSTS